MNITNKNLRSLLTQNIEISSLPPNYLRRHNISLTHLPMVRRIRILIPCIPILLLSLIEIIRASSSNSTDGASYSRCQIITSGLFRFTRPLSFRVNNLFVEKVLTGVVWIALVHRVLPVFCRQWSFLILTHSDLLILIDVIDVHIWGIHLYGILTNHHVASFLTKLGPCILHLVLSQYILTLR